MYSACVVIAALAVGLLFFVAFSDLAALQRIADALEGERESGYPEGPLSRIASALEDMNDRENDRESERERAEADATPKSS